MSKAKKVTPQKETEVNPMSNGLQSKNKPKKDNPVIKDRVVEQETEAEELITENDALIVLDVSEVKEEPVQKITEKIAVKYVFTNEEISEKGIQLGRLHQNVEQIKDEIKEIVSLKKSQIEQSNASINELSRHVTNGYTFVDEVCKVVLMHPEPGKKSYYKMDGTFVETRSMMPMDYQAKMQFDLKTTQSDADDKAISEMDNGKDRIRD